MACLYRHIRLDTNVPFYIGIGSNKKRAYNKVGRNNYWKSIVNKTEYEIDIIFDDVDYDWVKKKEIEFIDLYKRKIDGGTLCNITLGGEGANGYCHTEQAKIKMGQASRGRVLSDFAKEQISKTHKGKIVSAETRLKLSKASLGINNSMYNKKVTDDVKNKMYNASTKGENSTLSKLKESDIIKIREMSKNGNTINELSAFFNTVRSNIMCIINRKTWKHI